MRPAFILSFTGALLAAQAPLQVGTALPPLLDLRNADAALLVPRDSRDPAQAARAAQSWTVLIAAHRDAPELRLRPPADGSRLPPPPAASPALKAPSPPRKPYPAFDAGAPPILDETAWGALEGGALEPADLGPDPTAWRGRLAEAQSSFPGRPWLLWVPADPGADAATLMGDGGRLIVPPGGPTSALARLVPPDFTEVEGGRGDLLLRRPGGGMARRWRFLDGAWAETPLPDLRHEVAVSATADYDVASLIAKVRAFQLRERLATRTLEGWLDVDLHIQAEKGAGRDLGFTFRLFEHAGEGEELLQEQVRFNGVRAKVAEGLQLPIVESRASLAPPTALALTERYRYRDGGAASTGCRRIAFSPVDNDPLQWRGELVVEEASGRILREVSERSDLPGTVRSERRTLVYGETAGRWRVLSVQTSERWTTAGGVAQVMRNLRYRDLRVNGEDFEASRAAARISRGAMIKATPEGLRPFVRRADGTRVLDGKPRTGGRAFGGALLVDPGFSPPVLPVGGLAFYDFNAFGKGIQVNAFTALLFNSVSVAVPRLAGGFDLRANAVTLLWPAGERPVQDGRLADKDEVARRWGFLNVALGRDLGGGWHADAGLAVRYDAFLESKEEKRRTPGYALPPSGWTTEGRATLSWLWRGFQLRAFHAAGRRPDGIYGTAEAPLAVPEHGRFTRSGASLGLDRQIARGLWLHADAGRLWGTGFDRFKALDLGLGGEVRIAGIRSNAVAADRLDYAKAGLALPATASFRLSLSLDHARARTFDTGITHRLTGLGVTGDLPGFGWFTTVRVDLGVGLQSDIPGLRTVNGLVAFLRVF